MQYPKIFIKQIHGLKALIIRFSRFCVYCTFTASVILDQGVDSNWTEHTWDRLSLPWGKCQRFWSSFWRAWGRSLDPPAITNTSRGLLKSFHRDRVSSPWSTEHNAPRWSVWCLRWRGRISSARLSSPRGWSCQPIPDWCWTPSLHKHSSATIKRAAAACLRVKHCTVYFIYTLKTMMIKDLQFNFTLKNVQPYCRCNSDFTHNTLFRQYHKCSF